MEYVPIWERDAEKRGEKRGEERGILKKAKETAKKMLKKGFDVDTIMEITGLKRSEIEKLGEIQH